MEKDRAPAAGAAQAASDLESYRARLGEIDKAMAELFTERLYICRQIGLYKKEHGMPYFVKEVEDRVIERFKGFCPAEFEDAADYLINALIHEGIGIQERLG